MGTKLAENLITLVKLGKEAAEGTLFPAHWSKASGNIELETQTSTVTS